MRVTKSNRRLAGPVLCIVLLALTQVSCSKSKAVEAGGIDFSAEALPFAQPKVDPLYTLPGIEKIPDTAQRALDIRRAFFARRFDITELALTMAHDNYLNGLSDNSGSWQMIESIQDTQLAGIDACTDWLQQMPNSYPAHWVCGAIWQSGAWAARTEKLASEISAAQFAIMYERLQRSNALLEKAISLDPKPLEALAMLGANNYLGGDKKLAEEYLERAEKIKPDYSPIHWTRLNYAHPKWGGTQELVQAAFERAKKAGVNSERLLDMEDEYIVQPGNMSNPGAARAYWEKVIRENPTKGRLTSLRNDLFKNENWNTALPVASRLVDEHPDESAYYWRARININLGRMAEARDDYRMAAAMGNDLALQELIMANIRGGLGLTEKSFDEAVLLCRYGASLGSGVGANCIGSLSFEGGSADVPFPRNDAQGLAWHLLGARAGHYNSQHDLGWMLFTGRGSGVESETAKRLGVYWLRRAAEQGHQFAKKKLQQNKIELSEPEPSADEGSRLNYILTMLYNLIRVLI